MFKKILLTTLTIPMMLLKLRLKLMFLSLKKTVFLQVLALCTKVQRISTKKKSIAWCIPIRYNWKTQTLFKIFPDYLLLIWKYPFFSAMHQHPFFVKKMYTIWDYYFTVWKLIKFSVPQNLREINFSAAFSFNFTWYSIIFNPMPKLISRKIRKWVKFLNFYTVVLIKVWHVGSCWKIR